MDSLSLESALGVPPTSTTPHDWSIIDTWFVKLKVDFYWSIALQTHVDGLHSLLARIWNELKNPTKQRVNNLFAQIQAARTRLSMTPRDLTALLPSEIDVFELWLIDNPSVEWTRPIAKEALDNALQLIREATNSQGQFPAMIQKIRQDPCFDKENWTLMIGNRQGRVLRALIYLKNDILDVKAYNTQYRRAQKLPQPLSPDELLDISFEHNPPVRQDQVPTRPQPDGITRRLVKLESFKAKRYRPAPRTVEELQHPNGSGDALLPPLPLPLSFPSRPPPPSHHQQLPYPYGPHHY